MISNSRVGLIWRWCSHIYFPTDHLKTITSIGLEKDLSSKHYIPLFHDFVILDLGKYKGRSESKPESNPTVAAWQYHPSVTVDGYVCSYSFPEWRGALTNQQWKHRPRHTLAICFYGGSDESSEQKNKWSCRVLIFALFYLSWSLCTEDPRHGENKELHMKRSRREFTRWKSEFSLKEGFFVGKKTHGFHLKGWVGP